MTIPRSQAKEMLSANVGPTGAVAIPDVHLIALVDLLAEAYIGKVKAANDNVVPSRK